MEQAVALQLLVVVQALVFPEQMRSILLSDSHHVPGLTAHEQRYHALLPSLEHFRSLTYWAVFSAAFAETALMVELPVLEPTLLVLLGAVIVPGFTAETSGDSNRSNHALDPIAVSRWPELGRSPRPFSCSVGMSLNTLGSAVSAQPPLRGLIARLRSLAGAPGQPYAGHFGR